MIQRPDEQREIDWYGERAKRKHGQNNRRATWRGAALGALLTIALVTLIIVKWRDSLLLAMPTPTTTPLDWPILSPYVTVTRDPAAERIAANATLTQAAIFAPTVTPFMIPSATLTPAHTLTPTPLPDRIVGYLLVGATLYPVETLQGAAAADYHFTALALGANNALTVADARSLDAEAPCDPNEAIWHILPDHTTIQRWAFPAIGHPKRLIQDVNGGTIALAFDCQHQMWVIFRLDANGQTIGVPFSIVGGAALAVSHDGQIAIGLSGFADQAAVQPHLLTLRPASAGSSGTLSSRPNPIRTM